MNELDVEPAPDDAATHADGRRETAMEAGADATNPTTHRLPGGSRSADSPYTADFVPPAAVRGGEPVICAVDDDGLAPGVLATAALLARR